MHELKEETKAGVNREEGKADGMESAGEPDKVGDKVEQAGA